MLLSTVAQAVRSVPPVLRRVLVEIAVIGLPAAAVLLGLPSFGWSVPAALVACLLLPLRHLRPPLAVIGGLWGVAGGLGWPPMLVALYELGRRSRRPADVVPWLAVVCVAAVAPVLLTQELAWHQIVLMIVFVALYAAAPAAMGLLVSTRERLTESLRQLEAAREEALAASQDAARAQERARIGREIHDAVGHHATLIAVGAAAIAASTREEETRRSAEQLRALAKRALAEMRAALGLVEGREQPAAGLTEIGALVAGSRAAGVDVELVEDGEPAEVAPGLGRAAYRVVQEALTNAARHAPGGAVRVELHWQPAELEVVVRNSAPGRPVPPRPGFARGGAGLTGLCERVTSVGGHLAAGPQPDGGFVVRATFPLDSDDVTDPTRGPEHEPAAP